MNRSLERGMRGREKKLHAYITLASLNKKKKKNR